MNKKIVTITGAAGNIAYSLIFRILSNNVFDEKTKIQLNLLDIEEALPALKGIKYEIEDCAFTSLDSIKITDNAETAFADSDYIILVGAKPRSEGMQRADLLLDNANIFKEQALVINAVAKKSTKVIVVGNPANTNALIVQNYTKRVSSENITSLMRLDQNRAKSILSAKINCSVDSIRKLVVWGNHSATQFPDISHTLISGDNAFLDSLDSKWIYDDFIPRVQNRGAEIIKQRGKSSAASAASAIYDHLNTLVNGSDDWQSMGIMSDNSFDINNEIFFSYPLNITNKIQIINDIDINKGSMEYIRKSEKELISERDIIKDLLSD